MTRIGPARLDKPMGRQIASPACPVFAGSPAWAEMPRSVPAVAGVSE